MPDTKKTLLFVILMVFSARVLPAENSSHDQSDADTIRVLFIGNSYTYYNDLPGMLSEMTRNDTDRRSVEDHWYGVGGAKLEAFWEEGLAEKRIRTEGSWDYVVLQENSMGPSLFPQEFANSVRKFDQVIRESGATALLYSTWAHQDKPWMYTANDETFQKISKGQGIDLVPVGLAWKLAFDAYPDIKLYQEDGSHPSEAGSYAAACVFYLVVIDGAGMCPVIDRIALPEQYIEVIRNAAKQAVRMQAAA